MYELEVQALQHTAVQLGQILAGRAWLECALLPDWQAAQARSVSAAAQGLLKAEAADASAEVATGPGRTVQIAADEGAAHALMHQDASAERHHLAELETM